MKKTSKKGFHGQRHWDSCILYFCGRVTKWAYWLNFCFHTHTFMCIYMCTPKYIHVRMQRSMHVHKHLCPQYVHMCTYIWCVCIHTYLPIYTSTIYIWVDVCLGSNIFDRHIHELFVNMHQTSQSPEFSLGNAIPDHHARWVAGEPDC